MERRVMSRQQQLHGVMAVLRSSQTGLTCALRMRQLVLNYTEPTATRGRRPGLLLCRGRQLRVLRETQTQRRDRPLLSLSLFTLNKCCSTATRGPGLCWQSEHTGTQQAHGPSVIKLFFVKIQTCPLYIIYKFFSLNFKICHVTVTVGTTRGVCKLTPPDSETLSKVKMETKNWILRSAAATAAPARWRQTRRGGDARCSEGSGCCVQIKADHFVPAPCRSRGAFILSRPSLTL